MKRRIKNVLKRLPLARYMRIRLLRFRELAEVRKLFTNHEVFTGALQQKGKGTVTLETRDGLNFTIRQNIWDARIVKEIFLDKPYVRFADLPPNPTIVDIGGYIGDFSVYAAKYLNAKRVVVYEPITENFSLLMQNVAHNSLEGQITAVNKAVGGSGEMVLNVEVQKSEEVHVSAYWYQDAEHRIVPSVTLPDLMASHQLDVVDLLKVDCEGGEYDIFPLVGDDVFSRIRNIVFEWHRIDGFEPRLELVMTRLRSAGYVLRTEGAIVYASRGSPGEWVG